VVGKDPVELEKYFEKKICSSYISTVTKYYSSYVAVPLLRKFSKM
jgi:hypothetical protein